jgi:ABC-type bacteriocin/lantibiotic exporter with double-glycine peptidase domain
MRHNIILCCLGLAVALSIATSPFLIGNAINLYLSQDNYYLPTISIACLLILATPALRLSANIYLQKISAKTRLNMKTRILKNLFTTNFSADRKSGELIDLIDGDVDGALYLYHGIFLDLTINSTIIILALFMIAYYYPLMIIAPLAAMTLSASLYFLTKKNCNNLYTEYVTENTTTIGKICNLLTSAKKNKNKSLQEDVKKSTV